MLSINYQFDIKEVDAKRKSEMAGFGEYMDRYKVNG